MAIGRQSHQAERQFRKLRNHKVQAAKLTLSAREIFADHVVS